MFVDEYMIDKNATQAYLRAGYKSSYAAARVSASKLLTKPNIVSEIEMRMAKERIRLDVTRERVVDELAKVAFLNVTDLIDTKTGELKGDATLSDTAALSEVQVTEQQTLYGKQVKVSAKTYDKMRALDLLMRYLGLMEGAGTDSGMQPPTIIDDMEGGGT